MSTKKVSTTQFNPAGESAYNSLIPQYSNTMSQFMNDPMKSTFFNQMLGMGQANIGQQNQTSMNQLTRNAMGMGGGQNPYLQSLMAQQGRGASAQNANLCGSLLNNASNTRFAAAGNAGAFQPLQTGSTQTTGGLGSWLPQLMGAGLGMAGGFLGGGAGGIGAGIQNVVNNGGNPFFGSQFGKGGSSGGYGGGASQNMMPMPQPLP